MNDAMLFFGFLLLLVVVWIARGATAADVRGIFINPPPPAGQGGAYGPTPGTISTSSLPHY